MPYGGRTKASLQQRCVPAAIPAGGSGASLSAQGHASQVAAAMHCKLPYLRATFMRCRPVLRWYTVVEAPMWAAVKVRQMA